MLRSLRISRGLSQREVAGRAGVPPAALSRIEQGSANPTAKTLFAVARALGGTILPIPFEQLEEVKRAIGLPAAGVTEPGDVFDDVFIPDAEE